MSGEKGGIGNLLYYDYYYYYYYCCMSMSKERHKRRGNKTICRGSSELVSVVETRMKKIKKIKNKNKKNKDQSTATKYVAGQAVSLSV